DGIRDFHVTGVQTCALPILEGLNVTIPYKQQVIPYLSELEPGCKTIGAVNTIKINKGRLSGFNTDYYGFKKSLSSVLAGESLQRSEERRVGKGCRSVSRW